MDDALLSRSRRKVPVALAVMAALIWTAMSGNVLRPLLAGAWVADIPYAVSLLVNISDFVVMLALVSLGAGLSPPRALGVAGLREGMVRPLLFAAASLAPSLALAAVFATRGDAALRDVIFQAGVFPFIEEVVYRGLAIGALMRLCGWPFPVAALLPAAFFGAAHAAQGEALAEIAGVVAITGLGGLLFGWLFVRWGFNLWPPILLHIGMNALWLIFNLGDNAIGGWFGNAQRLAVVALAVALSLVMAPKRLRS